jgi:DNA repair protein RadC
MKLKDLPLSEQPREKALLHGVESLSDAELLALVIQSGVHGEDVLSLANRLLSESGGLLMLASTSYPNLKLKGLGKAKRLKIMAVFELSRRKEAQGQELQPIADSQDAFLAGKSIALDREESIMLLCLDSHKRLVRIFKDSAKRENKTLVDPQVLLKTALSCSASYAYLLHNHPSGNLSPSDADAEVSNLLFTLFRTVGIILLDHLIVGAKGFYSIKEQKMTAKVFP